ncbi:MAG: hypothetical protein QM753_11645 [Thermomicrobiales bacterium]
MSTDTVVVELPITLSVTVAFPQGAPKDAQAQASTLATWVAQKLGHVSHDQINAVVGDSNRVFPHGTGVVAGVETRVETTAATASLPHAA